jgi:ADP-heptose:LPS heptosyltransferase
MRLHWVKFLYALKNRVIDAFRFFLFRKPNTPSKVLLFRTGSIGDNICAMPAIVAVRKKFPNAQLHILTNAGATNLVSLQNLLHEDYYDKVIDYFGYRPKELFNLIKKEKYDLIVELPQDQAQLIPQLRNMFFFRLAGIRSGFGWQVNTIYSFRQVQEREAKFISERTRLLNLLAANNIIGDETSYPLKINEADRKTVESLLKDVPARFVAVVPGAKRSQNRYPLERFKTLTSWLVGKGYSVLIVGGPEDRERGQELSGIPGAYDFTGKLTPAQSAHLLSHCFLTISNDTGPMHLSYAVGTPVIGLFSSRDFQEKWFPPEGNIALRNYNVHCSLCFSETCADNICMQGIPIDEVKDAFLQMETALR